jgi:hypothetical protein
MKVRDYKASPEETLDELAARLSTVRQHSGTQMLVDIDVLHVLLSDHYRLLETLVHMVDQHCHTDHLETYALTANRDAVLLLAHFGLVKIASHVGRNVVGNWVTAELRKRFGWVI